MVGKQQESDILERKEMIIFNKRMHVYIDCIVVERLIKTL